MEEERVDYTLGQSRKEGWHGQVVAQGRVCALLVLARHQL